MSDQSQINNIPAPVSAGCPTDILITLARSAENYARHARADSTRRAYDSHWRSFLHFCDQNNLPSLPTTPATIALFLTHRARDGVKVGSLRAALSSIGAAHRSAGQFVDLKDADLSAVWAGIRREIGVRPNRKAPVLIAHLRQILASIDRGTVAGKRDAAVLLISWGAALRRLEVVDLNIADVSVTSEGLVVTIRRSKTDQECVGVDLGIARGRSPMTCPVRAYQEWIAASGITTGPVFRRVRRNGVVGCDRLTDRAVALIVKKAVGSIGLDPDAFSGHSLRAGVITSAAMTGASLHDIMNHSRHKSVDVARSYIRNVEIWQNNITCSLL